MQIQNNSVILNVHTPLFFYTFCILQFLNILHVIYIHFAVHSPDVGVGDEPGAGDGVVPVNTK